ncbi:EpsG family protein [Prevotella melaninogenica]|jgi:hypothetical protein|uniref:EpsG family protein n=1 Tax=Prevotella melaninogenica TaxID=28132 RepID=UPI00242E3C31|nr:EpsG family protein [Prevotella melaninogenica]
MFVYFLILIVAFVYYVLAHETNKSNSPLLLGVFFLYCALFIGLGDMIGGYDRYIYGEMFDSIADATDSGRDYSRLLFLVNGREYGYFLWEILVSQLTANRYIFILFSSLLMYFLYYKAFRKYISDYPLASIIFLGLFFYFSITYMRQALAVGIAWQGIKYLYERKAIKFFLIVALAYSFHNSALVFAVAYFIPIKKYSKKTILYFLMLCLLVGMSSIPTILIASAGDTQGMAERTGKYQDDMSGFRIEYIIEAIFFIWFFFKNYAFFDNKHKKHLIFLNLSIIFCGILLVFIRFGQGGRFGWYFFFGLIYTLTTLASQSRLFTFNKPVVMLLSILLYVRITLSWAFNLTPYKTFLTPGVPSGDSWIHDMFEYDERYTNDKFVRPMFRIPS